MPHTITHACSRNPNPESQPHHHICVCSMTSWAAPFRLPRGSLAGTSLVHVCLQYDIMGHPFPAPEGTLAGTGQGEMIRFLGW